MAELIAITTITRDEACQPRATTHLDLIEEYATALLDGAQFPAITLFDDGETCWLADGYHRLDAAEAACRAEILADIRLGTRRDAILFSLSANAAHGLRRTNEDKRRAVLTMLRDEEWSGWNDSEIARQCLVNHKTVASIRSTILGNTKLGSLRLVSRNGTTYEMNTALIGGAGDNGWRPATEVRAETWQPDRSKAYIHHAMQAVLKAIEQMPPPDEASEGYPGWAEHALESSRLDAAVSWLTVFARYWARSEPARIERTRQMQERIREASNVAG